MIFYVLLGVFVSPFCVHIMLISWIFVHLHMCSSHLGYRCFDLVYQRIYVSYHVCFDKNVFPFENFEQIPQHLVTSL